MNEIERVDDSEIDLIEVAMTAWDGKWKIISIAILSVLVVYGYQLLRPSPNFKATTEIFKIATKEADSYHLFNKYGFFEVTASSLQSLFIEQLEDVNLFVKSIRKYELLDQNNFKSEAEYNQETVELASTITIKPPVSIDGADKGPIRRNWEIQGEYNDKQKWRKMLLDVKNTANQEVRKTLENRFLILKSAAERTRDIEYENIRLQMLNVKQDYNKNLSKFQLTSEFELQDLTTRIKNVQNDFDREMKEFEQQHEFELEDLDIKIANAVKDYDIKIRNRLAFLQEQAAIARKLGVAKNTFEAQTFASQNGILANVNTDTPFYLRGYEAIEKEIELIQTRKDKKAFTAGLFELEQKQRALKQDKTLQRSEKKKQFLDSILELEQKQRALEQDKTLERAERNKAFLTALLELESNKRKLDQDVSIQRAKLEFSSTPIAKVDKFFASIMEVEATKIENNNRRLLMLALAAIIGGMIGVIYVIFAGAVRKRLESIATT